MGCPERMENTWLRKDLKRALLKSARTRELSSSDMLMTRFDYFVWINVHDFCNSNRCFRAGKIAFVEMCMSVKEVARLDNADQPVDGFQSVVGGV